ncbi:MAG: histidine kinase [Niastella sp.]|nr:histidine kinase [Niastella sp.]
MKKNILVLGIFVCAGIAALASFPRLLRVEVFSWEIIATSAAYVFLFAYCCWLIHAEVIAYTTRLQQPASRIWLRAGVITVLSLSAYVYDQLFAHVLVYPFDVTPLKRMVIVQVRGFLISGFIYFILYYLYMLRQKQQANLELEQLKQAQLKANLSSLKEQISPHFLFNTLNTLSSLTHEQIVKEFVNELSNVYRYLLQYKENNMVRLEEELAFSQSYLYILKTRMEDAIVVHTAVPDAILSSKVPPLTLQLLIENAIKHNVAAGYKPLTISIWGNKEWLIVKNNYQPKNSTVAGTGSGLGNIAQRYKLLFDRDIHIEQNADSFTVKLPVIL